MGLCSKAPWGKNPDDYPAQLECPKGATYPWARTVPSFLLDDLCQIQGPGRRGANDTNTEKPTRTAATGHQYYLSARSVPSFHDRQRHEHPRKKRSRRIPTAAGTPGTSHPVRADEPATCL